MIFVELSAEDRSFGRAHGILLVLPDGSSLATSFERQ
jgi:hypothetical protein